MFLFRKKIPPVSEANRIFEARRQFRNLVETEILFTQDQSKENAIDLLSYLLDTIARDLCASVIANPLYRGHGSPILFSFPHGYVDEQGNRAELSAKQCSLELASCFVYVSPWDNGRTKCSLLHLKDIPFKFDESNHHISYYPEFSLCIVTNGFHSINAGRYYRKGSVQALSYDLREVFPHIKTDGAHWINAHSDEMLAPVPDFRLAGIYYLARRRWLLQNS